MVSESLLRQSEDSKLIDYSSVPWIAFRAIFASGFGSTISNMGFFQKRGR
jgi:hypothetical protein